MELELCRTYYSTGTNGCLFAGDELICFTIELPWLNNMHQHSCIPEGRYRLQKRISVHYGNHFLVMGVNGRSGILIHAANNALNELRGCIAPVSLVTAPGCGLASRKALKRLVDVVNLLKDETIFLTIKTL